MTEHRPSTTARTWLLFGFLCAAVGAMVMLVGLEVIPTEESSRNAPPWVIVAAGSVFFVAGLYMLVLGVWGLRDPGYIERVSRTGAFHPASWLVGAFIVSTFFAIAAWVAFGPGERAFSSGIGAGGVEVSGPASEGVGRFVFGVSAVMLGAASVWIWAWGLSKLLKKPGDEGAEPD